MNAALDFVNYCEKQNREWSEEAEQVAMIEEFLSYSDERIAASGEPLPSARALAPLTSGTPSNVTSTSMDKHSTTD